MELLDKIMDLSIDDRISNMQQELTKSIKYIDRALFNTTPVKKMFNKVFLFFFFELATYLIKKKMGGEKNHQAAKKFVKETLL